MFQVPAILKGQELGFSVIATDGDPDAIGLAKADSAHNVDLLDVSGCINLARHYQISGVLSVASELAMPTVAYVAETLGLPGPGVSGTQIATNKFLMRKLLETYHIPSPNFKVCHSLDEARKAAEQIGIPVVIKPTDNAGSRGVIYLRSQSDVPHGFSHALNNSREKRVLVEEFMPGTELSVEGFVQGGVFTGIALSDKVRTPPPYFLDTTVIFPSNQPAEIQDAACSIVKLAIEKAKIQNATIHAEVMVTETGPKVVEFATRGAGFKVFTDILPWVTGIDVVKELINLSTGQDISIEPTSDRGAVLHFPHNPVGQITRISGLDQAKTIMGTFEVEIYPEPGSTVNPLTSGADRVGHFITFGESREDAESSMELVENTVYICTV